MWMLWCQEQNLSLLWERRHVFWPIRRAHTTSHSPLFRVLLIANNGGPGARARFLTRSIALGQTRKLAQKEDLCASRSQADWLPCPP